MSAASSSQSPTNYNSTPGTAPSTSTSSSQQHSVKQYSCSLCKQRKVKCDKKQPCSACLKSGAECVAVVPLPPRRGKRKFPYDDSSGGNNSGHAGVITLP